MISTVKLIQDIENNTPIIFTKFGDGEYLCATQNFYFFGKYENYNCDRDTYTEKLSNSLKTSFVCMVSNCKNYMFGKWHHNKAVSDYFSSLTNDKVNWVNYDTIILSPNDIPNSNYFASKIKLYRAIKLSQRKKIIVCNELLIKSKLLLNLDEIIIVPLRNWFDEKFNEIIDQITQIVKNDPDNFMLITCCGMSSKVLISEMFVRYPNGIYLDFGSGLDFICTKAITRDPLFSYDYLYWVYRSEGLINDEWNDTKYDYIYQAANKNLGIHLKPPQ
jgi:hypothetical protein